MDSIDQIIRLMHWDRSREEQALGLRLADKVESIGVFFRPMEDFAGKPVWENCAITLCGRPDSALRLYLMEMLLWTMDLNWPGADRILTRLIQFQDYLWLSIALRELIPYVIFIEDCSWAKSIEHLCENSKVRELLDPELLSRIQALAKR